MVTISRRQFLGLVACAGPGAYLAWRRGAPGAPAAVRRIRERMGTTVHLTVLGDDRDAAAAAADAALDRMAALEALLSRHRPDSEVGRLNRTGVLAQPSPPLRRVIALAGRLHALGDGAFDVTVQGAPIGFDALQVDEREARFAHDGMALTLDGIGKGYIVDEAAAVLDARGFPNVLVEAGGDLFAAGRRTWRIGIRRPRPGAHPLLGRLEVGEVAVATSGDYFQKDHILDPRTGRPAVELASATVLAPTAALADGLATLAMVLGARRARELLEDLDGCEGCFVNKDAELVTTSGFAMTPL